MKVDLSKDLTVFVISAGNNPNYNDCISALKKQTVDFSFKQIKDIYPLSKAFQAMIDQCTTKYYIEVDEDMILNSNTIGRMYNAIIKTNNKIAMICFKLLDIHLNFKIHGIKIYKHNILKKYPYNLDIISCEMEQLERLKKDGYSYQLIEQVMGKHSPKWTSELIFDRYYDLMEKYKIFQYKWLENLPHKLWEIFVKVPSETNFHALLGVYSSIFSKTGEKNEKNFSIKNKGYIKVKSSLSSPHSATIYVTNKCDFKCSWCLRQHSTMEQFPDMEIKYVTQLLKQFPTIKACCVCGYGEPLLSPNLFPILKYLHSKSIITGLITNGSLLKEKAEQLAKNCPGYISVSLNASNQKIHQEITQIPNKFEHILEGIRLAVNYKIVTYLSYVCTKENLDCIPDFLKLAKKLGVNGVHLHNILPHFLMNTNNEQQFLNLVLTKKDKELIDKIKLLPEANIVKTYPILIDPDNPIRNCEFPWIMIAVNGNGSISTCNSIYPPNKNNGNIFDESLWHNSYCEKMREQFAKKDLPLPCKLCFRNWT